MKDKSIPFGGGTVAYWEEGNGPVLIFLHGFCEDHTVWNEFIEPFTANYRVILPDTPGFGKSVLRSEDGKEITTKEPVSIKFYADGVKALLDAESITQCLMVGHSLGGYMALNFASRYPTYLTGFGLFHSTAYPDEDARKEDREHVASFVRTHGKERLVREVYATLFERSFKSAHPTETASIIKHGTKTSTVEGIACASIAMRDRIDTTDVLRNSKVRVLFIIGKEDSAVDPEKALSLTPLPETAVICVLPGVVHMGMITAKEICRNAVKEWLRLVEMR
jgi:pimeloyl-ACP methyl ester carboxylesterase